MVSQTPELQTEVAGLISALRKAKQQPSDSPGKYQPIWINRSEAGQQLREALNRRGDVHWTTVSLSAAVAEIQKKFEVNLVLDTWPLKDAGIDVDDKQLTMNVQDVTLRQLLSLICSHFDLTFVIRDEVLEIAPAESLSAEAVVFPVGDLIDPFDGVAYKRLIAAITENKPTGWDDVGAIRAFPGAHALVVVDYQPALAEIEELLARLRKARLNSKPAEEQKPDALLVRVYELRANDDKPPLDAERVIELVRDAVDPQHWKDGHKWIHPVSAKLVIKQTLTAHQQIQRLLDELHLIDDPGGAFCGPTQITGKVAYPQPNSRKPAVAPGK